MQLDVAAHELAQLQTASHVFSSEVYESCVQVTVRKTVAIQEKLLRRWLLSMSGLLRSQNCSLADALLVWKSNVDQEFAGVEPCMICYSVINPSNRSLPKMCCKTCGQTFHSLCLFKWFKSAGKSNCPHCQCPW